jgi:formylglycine-generating enzyme required for sulfatase activity
MNRPERVAELRERLAEVERAIGSFRAALPETNDPAHRAFFAGLLDRIALIVENEREGATGNLVDAITKARVDLRRYSLPDQDPDLGGRTAAMTILRAERGNLVEALENALDVARDLALPTAPQFLEPLEVPRAAVAAAQIQALDERLAALDRAVGRLEVAAATADAAPRNHGVSQSGVINLSIRALKLDIAGARFETRSAKDGSAPATIDFGALARTVEAIRDTARELRAAVEYLHTWVVPAVADAGRVVAGGAERVWRGLRAMVRVVPRRIEGSTRGVFHLRTPFAHWREPVPGLPEEAWPDMVTLPSGNFLMGAPEEEEGSSNDERPRRRVAILRSFALGRVPVTFGMWDAAVSAGFEPPKGSARPNDEGWGRDQRPVINVSCEDAEAYCNWLNQRLGLSSGEYRLPTEAEWEYACRAGTQTPFSFGETISSSQVNYDAGYVYGSGQKGEYRNQTVPVGSLPANGWGLHEMHGNVREWVADVHRPYSLTSASSGGSVADRRIQRGGSWFNDPRFVRSAFRIGNSPGNRDSDAGFRLARTLG